MPASALMNVMVAAVRKAGRSLARDYGEVANLQVSVKGPANFVSSADHRAEDILYRELARARQAYGFLMEERGEVSGADKTHRWIVDPLDGTTNFLHSMPLFAISVALEREGEIVAGVVYNPASDELYTAEKGKGAFVNDRRLRVSARRALADTVVALGVPPRGRPGHGQFLDDCGELMRETAGVRSTGAASLDLAWTAAGRFDGYLERALAPWDIAAGLLLVREAGGAVTDLEGGENMLASGDIVAGNPYIQKALLAVARGGRPVTRGPATRAQTAQAPAARAPAARAPAARAPMPRGPAARPPATTAAPTPPRSEATPSAPAPAPEPPAAAAEPAAPADAAAAAAPAAGPT